MPERSPTSVCAHAGTGLALDDRGELAAGQRAGVRHGADDAEVAAGLGEQQDPAVAGLGGAHGGLRGVGFEGEGEDGARQDDGRDGQDGEATRRPLADGAGGWRTG